MANTLTVSADKVRIFHTASEYKSQLLSLIEQAQHRIFVTALYLQDDEAGREILHALFKAKQIRPELEIRLFVDAHRAQRGLIGETEQLGNRALYQALTQEYKADLAIHGVAVKSKELFGVLHLKGMVFDDILFYTGASINDVYLGQNGKYRCDRYYQIQSQGLSNSFCQYLRQVFVDSGLAPLLNQEHYPVGTELKQQILKLKPLLHKAQYQVLQSNESDNGLLIEPLVGFGARRNRLNAKIRNTIRQAERSLVVFTPYFNLPKVITRDLAKALKRGVKVEITVGDKTANDFYIANPDEFSTIGIIPYIYEILLCRFVKRWKKYIDKQQLIIRLWKHDNNSFHLKGLIADERYHLVTGSNINPRAWSLDLENGLAIDDTNGELIGQVNDELEHIYRHTTKITRLADLESIRDYPEKPKKLLKKLRLTQIDRFLKRLL